MALTESERVNLPVCRGKTGTFENWVVLLFEPTRRRAYWLRYEVLAPQAGSPAPAQASLTVHIFSPDTPEPIRFARRFIPMEKVSFGPENRFHIRLDEAEMGHGFARGKAGEGPNELAWNLKFTTQREPSERTPTLLKHLPLPMKREHPNTEVRFDGTFDIGGVREEVRWAIGAQFHAWGERRMEERRWLYVPELVEDESAALELVQTRIERKVLGLPAPAFASFWLRTAAGELDLTELRDGWMHKVDSHATGSIHARSVSSNRAIVVHAHAPQKSLAAHHHRDPNGSERYVAKSAVADVTVEIFERPSRFGRFRPKQLLTARGAAAMEILGSEPAPFVTYVPADACELTVTARAPSIPISEPPPFDGSFAPFPDVHAIYASSETYGEIVEPLISGFVGSAAPPLLAKSHKTLLTRGDSVSIPASRTIVDSLLAIEPALASVLGHRYGFLPALLDYEVELGVVVLEEISAADLDELEWQPRLGWFVANDITARVCQLFGHGQSDAQPYFELGKSFAGFCPATPRIFVQDSVDLDAWPDVTLRTIVNGQVRQQASARDLGHSPRELLRACARRRGGVLEPGVVVLTGTPMGVAYRVSAFRRAIEDRVLDRFGKLEAAFGLYLESPDFLRPGDRVVVDGGFLGSREIVITG